MSDADALARAIGYAATAAPVVVACVDLDGARRRAAPAPVRDMQAFIGCDYLEMIVVTEAMTRFLGHACDDECVPGVTRRGAAPTKHVAAEALGLELFGRVGLSGGSDDD